MRWRWRREGERWWGPGNCGGGGDLIALGGRIDPLMEKTLERVCVLSFG